MSGYWTPYGAGASIDWCEPNYVHSHYVAELWNTLSSLWLVVIGLYGFRWCWNHRTVIEPRFRACFIALTVVGAGSAAFHGTMLKVAQALDELPMVLGGLMLLYCMLARRPDAARTDRLWQIGLVVYGALFAVGYFSFEDYFIWFICTYAAIVAAMVIGAARLSFGVSGSRNHQRLAVMASCLFVGGVVVFWVPEHVLLDCHHPLQALHLHSGWHILAGAGSYLGILFALYDRLVLKGYEPQLNLSRGILILEPPAGT